MDFRKITAADADAVRAFISESENACENTFVNMLVWQNVYNNEICLDNGNLFMRSGSPERRSYRLPFGGDLEKNVELIRALEGKSPVFWVPDGKLLEQFVSAFSDEYEMLERRDAFDYVYERDALAELAGKKYHSKRNHISAFSKKHEWRYEKITQNNIDRVRECAESWYTQKADKLDRYMLAEKQGIEMMLSNMEGLGIKGGAIAIGERVVAFTLGSAINDITFDIHVEKALADFAEAYTVINREFVRNELADYKFINREDDMGLEGLRKAKLSYKPAFFIKKYRCVPKAEL